MTRMDSEPQQPISSDTGMADTCTSPEPDSRVEAPVFQPCHLAKLDTITFTGGGLKGRAYTGILMVLDMLLKVSGRKDGMLEMKGYAGSSIGALWAMLMAMNTTVEEMFAMTSTHDATSIFQQINLMQLGNQFGAISNKTLIPPLESMLMQAVVCSHAQTVESVCHVCQ
jgi:hypothetical protein